ncbi:general substrate transporter [Aspergillus campestris IBT 28561]|uniref:General substrate transporter n=1 Tax=Aspergillus campestris (strain IBT 28561) TaxID=1392248 RepID=A0A2I1D8G2_ASPC2|nr:general substrate transporter [Aspergillus campestris IBT 28561]PKY06172.1 general substrate transporter [Aspergillus campestris IBT 28561]
MGKAEETIVGATEPQPHFPVVAEGTGKTAGNEGATSKEVYNAELYAAIQESNIPRWSRAAIHLYLCVFIAFCCACANGYDGSLMGSITVMPHFKSVMHSENDGWKVSVMTSLYSVGSIITTPFAAAVSDRWGRRAGMISGAVGIILGSVIAASAFSLAQVTVGRLVLGSGIQFMTVAAPAYSMEIAPPQWRGRCTGFYNCGWFGGSIPAALVTFGCQYIDNTWSWRIPFIGQCVACFIVLGAVAFIPESPRYLFAQGREEEAIEFLVKFHGNGERSSRLVQLEIEEIRESIRQEMQDKAIPWWDFRCLVDSHESRWRSTQVLMMGVFGQFSGNGLGYFNPEIFNKLGVKSTSQQLGYNVLNSVLSAIGAGTAVSLTDRMPRRPVLVYGTFLSAVMLAINGGVSRVFGADHSNANAGRAALAFYFLFNVVYSFAYTPLQGVVPVEALDTHRRAKGLAFYGFLTGCLGFINTFCTPIANKTIGLNYIWVFVGWDCVEAVLWYLFAVEGQGRTLEELEWVYKQPNPVKASQRVDKVVQQADGTVTEKVVDHTI